MLNRSNQEELKKEQEYNATLLELSADAVISYEKYLLDQLNHKELAKIMKTLRDHIDKKKTNKSILS